MNRPLCSITLINVEKKTKLENMMDQMSWQQKWRYVGLFSENKFQKRFEMLEK